MRPLEKRSNYSAKLHDGFLELSKAGISSIIKSEISGQFGNVFVKSEDLIIVLNPVEEIFGFIEELSEFALMLLGVKESPSSLEQLVGSVVCAIVVHKVWILKQIGEEVLEVAPPGI